MPTILVVDDTEANRDVLARRLGRNGYRVAEAADGPTALAYLEREPADLVLLDVMMPGKSGFEICQAVRADDTLAGVKIVLLTAKGRDTDVAKGVALGADAYVTKPFSTKELLAKVEELLGA